MDYRLRGFGRAGAWLTAAVLMVSGLLAFADPQAPTTQDRHIALVVSQLLKRQHLSKHPIDDEISQRAFKKYIELLDPNKVYFYQSDIDEFKKYENQLDDLLRRGDISFAHLVFNRYLQRLDERVTMANQVLDQKPDFTIDEQMVVDRDETTFPKTEAEALERWRKKVKYDLLVLEADNAKKKENERIDDPVKKLRTRYEKFAQRMHQTDSDELLEMYLTSVTTSFDPHTNYMSPDTQENFNISLRLELQGIGASLKSEDGYTIVHKIIPGGAAAKQGQLKEGDKIVAVAQGPDGELVDVVDTKLGDVVDLIRGKKDTVVRLKVEPAAGGDTRLIDITRDKIELTDEQARWKIFEEGRKPSGQPYRLGYIKLPSFYMDMEGARRGLPNYRSTTRDVKAILDEFNRQGVDACVLDLRFNGGGSLTEAISLTGLFIKDGPVVQVKDSYGNVQPYDDPDPSVTWNGPLVVLTNKLSASASEILAGAIQDYGRGLIVGDQTTHGKGTVQSLLDLGEQLFGPTGPHLGALKITMQQFYRPLGDSTQNRGVVADLELPALTTHLDIGEADLDYPVAFDHVDPRPLGKYELVNKDIVGQLAARSAERQKASEDFAKVLRNIDRYNQQKEKKSVTLNEAKFLAERAELNADAQEEELQEMSEASGAEIKRDYYLDEAFAVTADYLDLLNARTATAGNRVVGRAGE